MNFEQSDDRRMLAETLRRFLSDAYKIEHRNDVAYSAPFHDPSLWDALSELGIFYAFASENNGGMGGTGFDIATVFEEIGRSLCPEPVLGQCIAASLFSGVQQFPETLLSGTDRYSLAFSEHEDPYSLGGATTAAQTEDAWRISGRRTVVYGAGASTKILVPIKADDGSVQLFQTEAHEVEVLSYGMIDGGPAGEVIFDDAKASLVLNDCAEALAHALNVGALALAAEALGAMETTLAYLKDYLGTRTQFGKPIGAFQALQHRAIDLMIELEQARSSVILAADAAAKGGLDFSKRASQAKHLVGKIARQVSEEAIQMHGGIGITWEYPVSHYAKRLVMIDHQLGDTDHHLELLAAGLTETLVS